MRKLEQKDAYLTMVIDPKSEILYIIIIIMTQLGIVNHVRPVRDSWNMYLSRVMFNIFRVKVVYND